MNDNLPDKILAKKSGDITIEFDLEHVVSKQKEELHISNDTTKEETEDSSDGAPRRSHRIKQSTHAKDFLYY